MTQRSVSRVSAILALAAHLSMCVQSSLHAQSAAQSHLKQVIAANSLIEQGKPPFHLQMSFEYYDLTGKGVEAGTLEEWWVSEGTYLITVAVPSLNQGKPTPLNEAQAIDPREIYMLRRLLEAETHPVPSLDDANKPIMETRKRINKVSLTCFSLDKPEAKNLFCIDPVSDTVTLKTDSSSAVTMWSMPGKFEKTKISFNLAVAYGGRPAVTGHLRSIEVFDPAKSDVLVPHEEPAIVKGSGFPGIVPGKLIKRVEATFPENFEGGVGEWSVYLSLHVMKDGSTSHIFAVNSPNPAMTKAAIKAIESWKFEPFTDEGRPVEVEIAVEVKFSRG